MFKDLIDLVTVFGCVLLFVLGGFFGVVLSGNVNFFTFVNSLAGLIGASGGLLAGVAAICGMRLWLKQITLPKAFAALDDLNVLIYEIKDSFEKVLDKNLEVNIAIHDRDSLLARTGSVDDIFMSSERTECELRVGECTRQLHNAKEKLNNLLHRFSASLDKCCALGLDGFVLCRHFIENYKLLIEDSSRSVGLVRNDPRKILMISCNVACKSQLDHKFKALIHEITSKYKAG